MSVSAGEAPRAGAPGLHPTLAATPAWIWRLRHLTVIAALIGFSLNTEPGRVFNDTKMDLVLNPGAFLARAVHLWDPLGSGGQLQNQAYGYLFPMGPFFWLGELFGLPDWVIQRLWWALVLSVAYTGFVVVLGRLGMGSPWSRMVGGLAFALWPHVLVVLGRSSIEVWPPALAPWILLPLVGPGARRHPVRAALLSGVAITCMGGVNAVVNLAAVLPAALWIGTRAWHRRTLGLATAWVAAVGAATLWWVAPLLVLGRYSPPFLQFIESASFTTSTTALVEVLRGTGNWVAYVSGGTSPAGEMLLSAPVPILMSVLLTVAGLVGLARPSTPHRRYLVSLLLAGVLLVTLGHGWAWPGLGAAEIREALDGPLAPLRNVHKFDVLIRMAICVGLVAAAEALVRGRTAAELRFQRSVVVLAAFSLIIGMASPFFGLASANKRSFVELPTHWSEALDWLSAHGGQGRTLLLPGSRFAEYIWGYPGDEPIQATRDVAWDVRNAVPLTEPGHVRWLDAIEHAVANGHEDHVAQALASGGVEYVLLRSDLAFGAQASTRPSAVREFLQQSPGLTLAAHFGPVIGGPGIPTLVSDHKLTLPAPAIEIYRVKPVTTPVTLEPARHVARVIGGAESAVRAWPDETSFVRVGTGQPATDEAITGSVVLTDSPARREVNVGIGAFGASYTLSPSDETRIRKAVRDYGSDDTPGAEAVAGVLSGVQVSASTSAGDADAWPKTDPGSLPFAAFDASARTAWHPRPGAVEGAWVEATFPRTVDLAGGLVVFDERTAVRTVTLGTDVGETVLDVVDDRVDLPAVSTRRVRLTFGEIATAQASQAAGIRLVAIPGVTVERTVALPSVPDGLAPDRIDLKGDIGRPGCLYPDQGTVCAATLPRLGEDSAGLDRTFELRGRLGVVVTGHARAVQSPMLSDQIADQLELPIRASASSRATQDFAASPWAAVDGDPATTWLAHPGDPDPVLTLSWPETSTVAGLQLSFADGAALTRPTRVRVVAGVDSRVAEVAADGEVSFAPLTTTSLEIHFLADAPQSSLDPYTLVESDLPVGVSDVVVEGAPLVPVRSVSEISQVLTFPCGKGPTVTIAGRERQTRVTTRIDALIRGDVVPFTACGGEVTLGMGRTRITAGPADGWEVADLRLESPLSRGVSAPPVALATEEWGATSRRIPVPERALPSVLRVRENVNAGWVATLDGATLEPVTLDGWQQGWVVPAGGAGTVSLAFAPDGDVRRGMAAGLGLVVVLAGVALVLRRRGVGRDEARASQEGWLVPAVLGTAALVMVSGALGLVLAVAGAGVLALPTRGRLRHATWLPPAVGACYAVAGAILFVRPFGTHGYAANGILVQGLCLLALTLLIVSVVGSFDRAVASDEPRAAREPRGSAH